MNICVIDIYFILDLVFSYGRNFNKKSKKLTFPTIQYLTPVITLRQNRQL